MSDTMKNYYEAERRAKDKERETGIYIIDTFGRRDGVATRHLAREQGDRGWMRTLCGRSVINYHSARLVSQWYTDGSLYAARCPTCFCKDHSDEIEDWSAEVKAEYLSAVQGTD